MIDWLKFAEAKNTGSVGLSSTGLGVIVTFLVAGPPIPTLAGVGLGVGAVALMLSLMLTVASFLPSTNLEKHLVGERERPTRGTTSSTTGIWPAMSRERWSRRSPRCISSRRASRMHRASSMSISRADRHERAHHRAQARALHDTRCSYSGSACLSPPRPWRWRRSWSDLLSSWSGAAHRYHPEALHGESRRFPYPRDVEPEVGGRRSVLLAPGSRCRNGRCSRPRDAARSTM